MTDYIIEYETALTAPADADLMRIYDASTKSYFGVSLATLKSFMGSGIVDATASTLTATGLAHAGRTVTLNRAAGIAVTLPAASGTGYSYKFLIGTTVTSNTTTIKVANATDTMVGTAIVLQDGGDTMVGFEASGTADTVTLNGTTTGGIKGDMVELIDVAAGLYWVRVTSSATGTEATPFSATVS